MDSGEEEEDHDDHDEEERRREEVQFYGRTERKNGKRKPQWEIYPTYLPTRTYLGR